MTTPTTVNVRLQLRADTAANWTAANPTLLANEVGLETDTKKLKVGDGSTAWASLAYFPSIVSGGTVLGNLEIGSTGTLTFEGSTADGFETTLAVTDPTADRTITLPDQSGTVVVSGNASIVDADIAAGAEIAVSKLANGTANQVLVTDGTDVSWSDDLTLAGNLTVNGTTTTINTQDLLVEDKNIVIGNVDPASDTTANGGGITLKGTTDKTINWLDATGSWTSSENIDLASGKSYRINGAEVLSATTLGSGVTSSSLTSVGTITSGTWQGSAIGASYLDSTVVTTGDTGTVTSTMIANGTIVDADVSASAAIAGSKIDPDFGSQTIETTGDLAINTDTLFVDASANAVGIGTQSPLQILQIKGTNPQLTLQPNADTESAYLSFRNAADGSTRGFVGYSFSNDSMSFRTNGLGTAATIDSSGRLLVGTSSSTAGRFVVSTTTGTATMVSRQDVSSGFDESFTFIRATASGGNVANNTPLGWLTWKGVVSGTAYTAANIQAQVDGTPGANDMPGRLVFSTTADGASSPTERMRIGSNGRLDSFVTNATFGIYAGHSGAAGTTQYFIACGYSATAINTGTVSFRVSTNGDVQNTNNSYGAISDIKLKENIVDANSQWGDIKALQVRNYNFKEGQTHTQIGLIAQEVELVSPGLVSESPDRDAEGNDLGTVTKSVNYSVLYMKAVKALQEAMERIETLEAKVAALESA